MPYSVKPGRATVAALIAWLGLASMAGPAKAQRPDGRVIPLPDTLGANFSIADSATKNGDKTDFDFLVGLWQFRFQNRKADGTYQNAFTGHWSAQKRNVPGGMVEDHWRPDDPNATWDGGTYTYRVWSAARKVWVFQGVNPNTAAWSPGRRVPG